MWDAATGQLLHTLPYGGIEYLGATLMFDDANERLALVAVGDNFESVILHIWDVNSGELLSQKELPIPLENFTLALSPDWKWIATGYENGTAELWNVAAAERLRTYSGFNDSVFGVAFNADGSRLAVTSLDGQVEVWNMADPLSSAEDKPILSFTAPRDIGLTDVFFSHDSTRLALRYRDEIALWDLADTRQPQFIITGHGTVIQYAAFHPQDISLTTSSSDSTAKVWDLTTGEELFTLSGHKGFVTRLDFSPDGNRIVTAGADGTARIWNAELQGEGERFAFAVPPSGMDLELSPDEQKIAVGSRFGPATIWEAATGKQLLSLPGESGTSVYRVAFHSDGSRIATVGEDGQVRIWDAETGKLILAFTGHIEGNSGGAFKGTLDVSYSPDGRRLATAGADGLAKVWDAETGTELLLLAGHTAGLHSLAYSPDGRYIATSSDAPDTTVKIWDAQTGAEVHTFGPNPSRAWGLVFNADSNWLSAAGGSGYIKVWNVTTGEEVINMTGQASTIGTVVFTPDEQRLITGSGESASVWDIATGTELLNLASGNRFKVALSQDGRWLYTLTEQPPAVEVLALLLEDAISLAHSRLTRPLTSAECRQYLHRAECP